MEKRLTELKKQYILEILFQKKIVSHIMEILKTVSSGKIYFELAIVLKEALLINGMLTNSDIWYGLHKSEISELEEVDKILLRRILEVLTSTSTESLYLELGLSPVSSILKSRRINYLHYLVNLN